IGFIILTHRARREWTEDDLLPYRITGAQLAAVLKNRIDFAKRGEDRERLAALEERQRLARELHDSVSQLIFSVSLIAQSVEAGFARSAEEGRKRVDRLMDVTALAKKEMRALLTELREPGAEEKDALPAIARREGLRAALDMHLRIAAPTGVEVRCDCGQDRKLNEEQSVALLRIAQEAIANSARHGRADAILIDLHISGEHARFVIDDNGAGFGGDSDTAEQSTRIGLASMAERARAVGGDVRLGVSDTGGARVEVSLPIG
ncbi:MAG: histidine kinase, partial [Pseudomonadota bacterium]